MSCGPADVQAAIDAAFSKGTPLSAAQVLDLQHMCGEALYATPEGKIYSTPAAFVPHAVTPLEAQLFKSIVSNYNGPKLTLGQAVGAVAGFFATSGVSGIASAERGAADKPGVHPILGIPLQGAGYGRRVQRFRIDQRFFRQLFL